jgi:hypothetical protein
MEFCIRSFCVKNAVSVFSDQNCPAFEILLKFFGPDFASPKSYSIFNFKTTRILNPKLQILTNVKLNFTVLEKLIMAAQI